jgi:HD-GYP domain-containing protein (c-di-GMP phosphodiesterase class II)
MPNTSPSAEISNREEVRHLLDAAWQCVENQPDQALEKAESAQLLALTGQELGESLWLQAKCLIRIGTLEQAKPLLVEAVEQFSQSDDPRRLDCQTALAELLRDLGQFEQASVLLQRTLDLAQHSFNQAAEATVLNVSASVCIMMGEPTEARQRLERVLQLHRNLGNRRGEAIAMINLGNVLNDIGDFSKSLEGLIQAYQIIKTLGEPNIESKCLINIGETHLLLEEPVQAIGFFEQAIELSQLQQHAFNEILGLIKLAEANNVLKKHAKAKELLLTCLEQARQANQHYLETSIMASLGETHLALCEINEAQEYYNQALIQAKTSNDSEAHFDALIGLGQTALVLKQPTQAAAHFRRALEQAKRSEQKRDTASAHRHLSEAYELAQNPTQALEHFKAHHELEREILNEDTTRKTKNISLQLDLERSKSVAEMYRLRTQVFEEANAMLEEKVLERTRELEEARIEVVMRLAVAAEYRDDYTGQHTFRVGRTSALIARALGVANNEVETLRMAARLHDIGKIGIPDLIMLKPAKLSFDEFERIKTHTTIGAQILSGGKTLLLKMAETIALTHHERWDGLGYPRGLVGENIPLLGRIVSVADVYDALTSERPYKQAWSAQQARDEIEAKAGTQFDPQVVAAFTLLLDQGMKLDAL